MLQKSTIPKTVDEYLSKAPIEVRPMLTRLRQVIKSTAPHAEEVISYQIPTYKQNGPVVCFAHQRSFCSLYGISKTLRESFPKELKDFEVKGTTIHFTPEHPLPDSLVKKIVKLRLKQNTARKAAKTK